MTPDWKIGVEIELLAPSGSSRRTLAEILAADAGGTVRPCFHPQAEPSKVPGQTIFENLTLGYDALDGDGRLIARCVDDLTLQDDLDRERAPKPGWWRIVSDDRRLLELVMQQCDPAADLPALLAPVADLFGVGVESNDDNMHRVNDRTGASVAIAAPLPGERERPCELITPPIERNHEKRLGTLLNTARGLGFVPPAEGATHIHFDAAPLQDAAVLGRLVQILWGRGPQLRAMFETNPRCRRLGPWPDNLMDMTREPGFAGLSWTEVGERLRPLGLEKFCDFNIANLVYDAPGKITFEARIFPVWMDAEPILDAAAFFAAVLTLAVEGSSVAVDRLPADASGFLQALPLDDAARSRLAPKAAAALAAGKDTQRPARPPKPAPAISVGTSMRIERRQT